MRAKIKQTQAQADKTIRRNGDEQRLLKIKK